MQDYTNQRHSSDSITNSASCPNFQTMDQSLLPGSSWTYSLMSPSVSRQNFIESSEFSDNSYYSQTPTKYSRRNSNMSEHHPTSTTHELVYGNQNVEFGFQDGYYQDSFNGCHDPHASVSSDNSFMYQGQYHHSMSMGDMSSNYSSSFGSQLTFDTGYSSSNDAYTVESGNNGFALNSGFVCPSQTTDDHSNRTTPERRFLKPAYFGSASSRTTQSPVDRLQYFMSPSPGTETDQDSPFTTPSKSSTPSQRSFPGFETSVSLQRVQDEPTVEKKPANKKYTLPDNLSIQKQAKRCCPWPGCQGRFQRQEHLKRHMKTHRNEVKLPCQFCGKVFGRADNLKSHIRLHMHPKKKSSRTDFFPGARRVYEEMSRKTRTMGNIQFVHEMTR